MEGQIFIARGDLSQLAAHAIGLSTDLFLNPGYLYPAFEANVRGFADWFSEQQDTLEGEARIGDLWYPTAASGRPHGVVVVAAAGGPATPEDKAATPGARPVPEVAP